ncbi:MAG: T9SS type A sorting domain-containing protein [Prevotellaceae bacterium]|jgi:hypothetical protein|nr:T9SS type A sorting domain-containing protein [Prevotellaceae bacterium]
MKKVFFTVLLFGSILSASANDVYVSTTGNDNNDGLSATSAFATFGKALTSVEDGGTVHVSGFLYACDDNANPLPNDDINKSGYAITKTVIVQGTDKATDGFIGFSEVTYNAGRFFTVNNDGILTLKNLTLKDGVGSNRSGGVFVNGGTLTAEDVIFDNCESMTTGSDPARGGAVEVEKTLGLTFKRCLFKNNKAPKGGAFYIQDTQNPNVELRFEACSFVGNRSSQGGASCSGLFFRLMAENLTINILNCTFSGNINASTGGAIYIYGAQASNVFNIVNSTLVDNIGQSNNSGSGAGISVEIQDSETRRPIINILNSIVEGNAIASGATAEDLVYGYRPSVEKCKISNSFIGKVFVAGAETIPGDCYVGTLYWDYMSKTFDRSEVLSGVDAFNSDYNVYPLAQGATALTYGNATFLQTLGISTDQIGRTRAFADGKCSVGAMEGVGLPASSGVNFATPENLKVYQTGENLLIKSVNSEVVRAELFGISGQAVAAKTAVGEINFSVAGLKGVYVAKISVAGEIYTQKVIIK